MIDPHNKPTLLIIAHGSAERPEDNLALAQLAEGVDDEDFAATKLGFLKATPDASSQLELLVGDVIIVPMLMSEGFFYHKVLPQRLGHASLAPLEVADDDPRRIVYSRAIGTHPDLVELAFGRVEQARELFQIPRYPHLLLVGHGSERHTGSSRTTIARSEELAASGEFAKVSVAFLDEPPFLDDQLAAFADDDLLVVPDFVGEGVHTRRDIPEALGLSEADGGFATTLTHGRRIWYTPPVGLHPAVVDIIVDRARQAAERL